MYSLFKSNSTHLGISNEVIWGGKLLSSATEYAKILSEGDQLKSIIPGILKHFLSSKPND